MNEEDFTKKGIFLSFFSKAINLRKGKAEHRSFSRELMEQMERPAGMHAGFGGVSKIEVFSELP